MRIIGCTHPGKVRRRNEDAVGWDERAGVAVLADGMGGLQSGDLASREAVRYVLAELAGHRGGGGTLSSRVVVRIVQEANRHIWGLRSRRGGEAMGTTLVAAVLVGQDRCLIVHVGDSRAYRMRGQRLEQLTTDHSLVQGFVDRGVMSAEESRSAPNRNVITRALGLAPDVDVAHREISLEAGDLVILCSDGLWEMLPDPAIAGGLGPLAAGLEDAADALDALVKAANAAGGVDNVSIVIMQAGSDPVPFPATLNV